ncbi:MAG: sigma 54 modulation protein/ribosomal protein [Bacteroidetes bacterium]|jgi:putative sigma-54 modulation protein|nr:sigma 54 modulation protein/ribosomal protein [Bacteroidota bacterium]
MKINTQSVHFDADTKLLAFVEEKVSKLTTYFENIVDADVTLRLDKSSTQDNKIAEIKLRVKGNELFAKKQCLSFEESIDMCVDALKTQLTKYKGKSQLAV